MTTASCSTRCTFGIMCDVCAYIFFFFLACNLRNNSRSVIKRLTPLRTPTRVFHTLGECSVFSRRLFDLSLSSEEGGDGRWWRKKKKKKEEEAWRNSHGAHCAANVVIAYANPGSDYSGADGAKRAGSSQNRDMFYYLFFFFNPFGPHCDVYAV